MKQAVRRSKVVRKPKVSVRRRKARKVKDKGIFFEPLYRFLSRMREYFI